MKKLAISLVAVALAVSACGGGDDVAATVDGTDITTSQIESLVTPAEGEEISEVQFADLLSFSIVLDVFARGAEEDFGISFTEDEIAAEADSIIDAELTGDQTREELLATMQVTEELLQMIAHQSLIQTAIREQMESEVGPPTQEEIDGVITEAEALGETTTCASHILVATEAEAQDVVERLEAGEEFADVALEVSIDGSSAAGGDLGCAPPEQYVPEFAEAMEAAEVGVPTAPVESEFGFHVILVREDDVPTVEEATTTLQAEALELAAQEWFVSTAEAAEVTVNEKYGTWETSPTPGVVPPAGATTTTTTG